MESQSSHQSLYSQATDEQGAEARHQEASSTAEGLKARMLECLRAAESVLLQRDRARRHPNRVNARDIIEAVLTHVTLDQLTASYLIKALARTDQAHLASEATDWLLETQPEIAGTHTVLNAAIAAQAYSCFKPDNALRYFHLRSSYGLPPCIEATNLALTACSHSGHIDQSLQLLSHMCEEGLEPTEYTAVMVLQAANFKGRGKFKEALRALDFLPPSLRQASAVVDLVLCVFESAVRRAESLEECEALFRQLEAVDMADSTRAYNAVLRACAARGHWQIARTFINRMTDQDVPADVTTFNALIMSALKGQALDVALDLYEWLVSGREVTEPLPADIATYNTLIKACHQAGLLEKALEITAWLLRTGIKWDEDTFTELISTVEIAQLWDSKVVSSPFYQLHKFSDGPLSAQGLQAQAAQPDVPSTLCLRAGSTHDISTITVGGHSGLPAPTPGKGETHTRHGNSLGGAALHDPPPPVDTPMVPLAIFPAQLRPAPFDGLRMMYLDQLDELQEESMLAAVKLRDSSWAARTLTRGGTGPRGKGPTARGTSAAGAMQGQGAFTVSTDGKATQPLVPKLPRILSRPQPVDLSPAPSFRGMNMDTVSKHRLEALNKVMLEGSSPRKDPRGSHNVFKDDLPSPSRASGLSSHLARPSDCAPTPSSTRPAAGREASIFGAGPHAAGPMTPSGHSTFFSGAQSPLARGSSGVPQGVLQQAGHEQASPARYSHLKPAPIQVP